MKRVLVAGATGFIGKGLVEKLLADGHEVYALSRRTGGVSHPRLTWICVDLEAGASGRVPEVDAAYYLVHSMAKKRENLEAKERETARAFVEMLDKTGCRQVIYLGGILPNGESISEHLRARYAVEEELQKGKAAVTVFRASIILGNGGASFSIIRDLVEKLPFMIAPAWVGRKCQPIALEDVLFYLRAALLVQEMYGKTFDIGGDEVLSFREVLLRYAKFRHLRRYIVEVPFLTPRLSSYWLVFVTSVPLSLCTYLVESMRCDTVCQKREGLPQHRCLSFEEALSSL